MFKELETKRLLLKNIGYEDSEFFFKEFSTDEVNTYLFDAEPCISVDEAREWIDFYIQEEPRHQHRWIIILKETNEKIGTCGFHNWNLRKKSVEIGYDLQPNYWRKGYMKEALNSILSFAKNEMKVKKISAIIAEKNIASQNLVISLGFHKTEVTYFENFREEKYLHFVYQLDL